MNSELLLKSKPQAGAAGDEHQAHSLHGKLQDSPATQLEEVADPL